MEKRKNTPYDDHTPERISWRVHERDLCRLASAYKSAIVVLVIALVLAAGFAGYEAYLRHKEQERWLNYLEEYDFVGYDYVQDGQGVNVIGNWNGVDYSHGAAVENQSAKEEESPEREGRGGSEKEVEEVSRENKSEVEVQRILDGIS